MLDTDALLQPTRNTDNQIIALMDVVKANTAVLKKMRADLSHCNNQEKVQALINDVEQALQDLSLDSQKIAPWIKAEPRDAGGAPLPYGQYPIFQPLNPSNPMPWPPGYTPPPVQQAAAAPVEKEEPVKAAPDDHAKGMHQATPQAKPAPVQHPDPRGKK